MDSDQMNRPLNPVIPSLVFCAVIAACNAPDEPDVSSDVTALTEGTTSRLLQDLEELAGAIEMIAATSSNPQIKAIWQEMEPIREDPEVSELIATIHENEGAGISSADPAALSMYLDSFDQVMEDAHAAGSQTSSVDEALAALHATMYPLQGPHDISPGGMALGSTYCCYIYDVDHETPVCWEMKTLGAWAATKCSSLAINLLAEHASLVKGGCDWVYCNQ